jgi:aminoglycoside phosphotransferase (APT) family kinase protein
MIRLVTDMPTPERGTTVPKGIDAPRLVPWLLEHVDGLTEPVSFTLIAGGRSNLTFRVEDDAGRRLVLRRPPLGHVLATAHDVLREHRILSALQGTGVPVAPVVAACDDIEVNGAPFYVMELVEGLVVTTGDQVASIDEGARQRIAVDLADVLADLHAVDLKATGLDTLARHDGYVARQVKRWTTQWEASKTRELPAIDEVAAQLAERTPPQLRTVIAHGDYRIGNCLVDPEAGEVNAVLDWELCTLGDPLADVGYVAMWWPDPAGMPPVETFTGRYAERSGLPLDDLDFYVALAAFRLAVIGEGVYARYRAGVMGDDDVDLTLMGAGVTHRVQVAVDAMERHRSRG